MLYYFNTINSLLGYLKEMLQTFHDVAAKYLNRYAVLFALIAMSADRFVTEVADQVRRILQNLWMPLTLKSAKAMKIIAIICKNGLGFSRFGKYAGIIRKESKSA